MKLSILLMILVCTSAVALERDNTANLGDKLDANNIEASDELRVNEIPNKPDIIDQNKTPAHLEERQREEEFDPVEMEKLPRAN